MDPLDVYDELRMAGEEIDPAEFAARYPTHKNLLARIQKLEALKKDLDSAVNKSPWPKRVAGYALGAMLGEGGMGAVFACGDKAIKLLHEGETLDRFAREAATTAALDHPNIVRVFDHGLDGRVAYIVTERIEGTTLRDVKDVPLDRVVAWGRALCDALAHAHDKGVIHRDVKPSNIMLAGDTPKIIDFGLALDDTGREQQLTRSGIFLGSRNYAAPEQLRGERANVGPHTDVFGLGATLYELATGQRAFNHTTLLGRLKAADDKPPSTKLPKAIDKALRTALSPSIKKRFATMAELKAALAY